MKAVIQRVSRAEVRIDGRAVGAIGHGLMVLVGFTHKDGEAEIEWMVRKVVGLRIFEDSDGKMNRSLTDMVSVACHSSESGKPCGILVVPQFTLYGHLHKGYRPSFTDAAKPELANELFERFCDLLAEKAIFVQRGQFGARMDVELVNNGPVTIILQTK